MPPFRAYGGAGRRTSYRRRAPMKPSYSRRPKPYRRVGGTKRKMAAPVVVGSTFKQGAGNKFKMVQNADGSTRVYGRSFIASVGTSAANFNSSDIGLVFDINPNLLADRVATIASTYEKYVYQHVKFTWVPQCGTTTAGSVVMVMDRDNLTDAANPSNQAAYLQEAMGYEHAVISPPWTECCVTYSREKSEKKIFQGHLDQDSVGSKDATQGNFLVYTMGTNANTPLGFIVMDYVLDLITPSLIPEKTGAGQLGYNTPSQWSFNKLSGLAPYATSAGGILTFSASVPFAEQDNYGGVYELCLAGVAGQNITGANGWYWDAGLSKQANLTPGSKLYAVVFNKVFNSTTNGANTGPCISFVANLNTALSLAQQGYASTASNVNGPMLTNVLYPGTLVAATLSFWQRRVVSTGVAISVNQA